MKHSDNPDALIARWKNQLSACELENPAGFVELQGDEDFFGATVGPCCGAPPSCGCPATYTCGCTNTCTCTAGCGPGITALCSVA